MKKVTKIAQNTVDLAEQSNLRVAAYCRVSTDSDEQLVSLDTQIKHYKTYINANPEWAFAGLYYDEGISGTSLKHRDAFIKMIADCKLGKIDLVVTKSVSRFARNVVDCIGYVRQLAAMQPPVGVFFEMESIYTLNDSSEMSLSFMSTLAQEESHIKSRVANDSIEKRFRRGIFLTPPLLGYDQDEDGNLVINSEEAKTVRLIFFMYLYGYTCRQIAEMLTSLERRTKKDNTAWAPGSILQILQNERHCGDILARKTWTPSYLDHLPRKNRNNHNQYTRKGNHEAIVSRDDFIAVQRLISNAKYGNKGILPELKVITEGALKGFVSINPRWAAFSADDYRVASESVYDKTDKPESKPLEVEAQSGDFDLRGFEVTRSQFFDTARKLCVTLSTDNIWFSTECIRKFKKELYVEMLIHPREHLLAVRPCAKECRNAVRWAKINEVNYNPRDISGAAYLSTLYEIFGWNTELRYRVRGVRRQKDNESVVIFDMRDTEIFIPDATTESYFNDNNRPVNANPKNTVVAFPPSWAGNFGNNYYRHSQARELAAIDKDGMWNVAVEGQSYQAGCLSYLTDRDSMIFYTVDDDVAGEFYKAPRRSRQVFCYHDGLLLQSRLYPECSNEAAIEQNRHLVQDIIAECLGLPSRWVLKKKSDDLKNLYVTVEGSKHYKDYAHGYGVFSVIKGYDAPPDNRLLIGSKPTCVCCGSVSSFDSGGLKCGCEDLVVCGDCGQTTAIGNARYHENRWRCFACIGVCGSCGRITDEPLFTAFRRHGGMIRVCHECYQAITAPCADCNVRSVREVISCDRLCPHVALDRAA